MALLLLLLLQFAKFVAKDRVAVGSDEYTADHILIAVGGEPSFPPIEGTDCIP